MPMPPTQGATRPPVAHQRHSNRSDIDVTAASGGSDTVWGEPQTFTSGANAPTTGPDTRPLRAASTRHDVPPHWDTPGHGHTPPGMPETQGSQSLRGPVPKDAADTSTDVSVSLGTSPDALGASPIALRATRPLARPLATSPDTSDASPTTPRPRGAAGSTTSRGSAPQSAPSRPPCATTDPPHNKGRARVQPVPQTQSLTALCYTSTSPQKGRQ